MKPSNLAGFYNSLGLFGNRYISGKAELAIFLGVGQDSILLNIKKNMVGVRGFEPPAPASRRQCSTRLSYTPSYGSVDMKW